MAMAHDSRGLRPCLPVAASGPSQPPRPRLPWAGTTEARTAITASTAPKERLSLQTKAYVRAFAPSFMGALAFLVLESLCDLLQPTIMSSIIDRGVAARDAGLILRLGFLMLLVALLGSVGAVGRNLIASRVSWGFAARLRSDLYKKALALSFAEFEGFDQASLVTRATNDVTQVQAFLNGMMRIFAKAPIVGVGSVVMAVSLEPRLAPVFFAVVPLSALVIAVNLSLGFRRFRRVQEGLDALNARVREFLSGIRLVKAYGREDREEALFAEANAGMASASTRAFRTMALLGPAAGLVVNLGLVSVLYWGGIEVVGGRIPLGHVMAFVTYLSQLLFALVMITGVFNFFVRARVSWGRIGEILGLEGREASTLGPSPRPRPRPAGAGTAGGAASAASPRAADAAPDFGAQGPSLRFQDVAFAYPGSPDRLVLEGLDFDCPGGSLLAVIGATGSGKSSLVKLLPRFHDPVSGSIALAGRDLCDYSLEALRRGIALVPQRSLLFSGSLLENLRWGREDAGPGELEEALAGAAALEFVRGLEEGLESRIGRGGVNLSGGQRQRLALARALLRRPSLLVLDDATSSVDALTEADILRRLRDTRNRLGDRGKGMTTVLVTQRIAAARAADLVLVLEGGRVAGFGGPATLAEASEVWRDMVLAQVGREARDGQA